MIAPDDPRHGTYAGALAHRRDRSTACLPCQIAARRYVKAAKVRLDKGIRNRVPLGQRAFDILTHVGPTAVAEQTGLWRNNLYRAQRRGPDQIVLRTTRDAILRVQGPTATGVQRRVRALAALGFTIDAIAAAASVHPEGLARMSRAGKPAPSRVNPHVLAGVVAAYDILRDTPPPTDRWAVGRRSKSAGYGWHPPAAWDDIDDPHEDPDAEIDADYLDPVVVERIADGAFELFDDLPNIPEAKRAVAQAWWAAGRSMADLERRTGWQVYRYFRVRDQARSA